MKEDQFGTFAGTDTFTNLPSLLTILLAVNKTIRRMVANKIFQNVRSRSSLRFHDVKRLLSVSSTEMPEIEALRPDIKSHDQLHRFSVEQPDKFWGELARSRLLWSQDFHTSMDCDMNKGKFDWFLGGRLNVSVNCVDRWAGLHPHRLALVWEKDEPGQEERISYKELQRLVCQIANCLKTAGVRKGDVVALYLPVSPVAVACMLATARLGAVHSVIFAGFSSEAVAARINDAGVKVVITADEALRGGKTIPLKPTVDKALSDCPAVRTVFVSRRTGGPVSMKHGRDVWLEDSMASESDDCLPVQVEAEDPLFLLYTSGSTGKPKVTHSRYSHF